MAMLLAVEYAARSGAESADLAARAIREAVLECTGEGIRTVDLGGDATTTEFTSAVIAKVRAKVDAASRLGSVA
jgi:isocitrate/isopropylmalate dehydrogenase